MSTAIVVVIGTLGAMGLTRYRFFGRNALTYSVYLPMIVPGVVFAVPIMALLVLMGLKKGFWAVVLGNVILMLPYMILTVRTRFLGLDRSVEEASMDLGASGLETFFRITLPDGWYSQGEWMLAIPASSTKTAEAELLINYIHDGKNYADNVMKYPGVPVNEACTQYLTDEYKELFKAFDIPETAHFFTLSSLSSLSSESLEMYDLFISNVMASSN